MIWWYKEWLSSRREHCSGVTWEEGLTKHKVVELSLEEEAKHANSPGEMTVERGR